MRGDLNPEDERSEVLVVHNPSEPILLRRVDVRSMKYTARRI
jgi:hypothetical protein